MNIESDMHLFTDKSSLIHIFQNQIEILNINDEIDLLIDHLNIHRPATIFMNILNMCKKLLHMKYYTSVSTCI
ncbi:hypothetical protein I4U23_012974 [Adineta vaga]|nr:hypothetical protein I4U23_012974 [Adineta vaga]